MTKRKKVEVSQIPTENQGDHGMLKVDEFTLAQLLRMDAEVRAATHEAAYLNLQKQAVLAKIDPNGLLSRLDGQINMAAENKKRFMAQNDQIMKALAEKLGIDLTRYSFDTETGVLRELL